MGTVLPRLVRGENRVVRVYAHGYALIRWNNNIRNKQPCPRSKLRVDWKPVFVSDIFRLLWIGSVPISEGVEGLGRILYVVNDIAVRVSLR